MRGSGDGQGGADRLRHPGAGRPAAQSIGDRRPQHQQPGRRGERQREPQRQRELRAGPAAGPAPRRAAQEARGGDRPLTGRPVRPRPWPRREARSVAAGPASRSADSTTRHVTTRARQPRPRPTTAAMAIATTSEVFDPLTAVRCDRPARTMAASRSAGSVDSSPTASPSRSAPASAGSPAQASRKASRTWVVARATGPGGERTCTGPSTRSVSDWASGDHDSCARPDRAIRAP